MMAFGLVTALALGLDVVAGSAATKSPTRNQRRAVAEFDTSNKEARRVIKDEAAEPAADVIELTTDNFDRITRNGTWFIDVYAPWCKHCKKLEPTWWVAAAFGPPTLFGSLRCELSRFREREREGDALCVVFLNSFLLSLQIRFK